MLGLETGGNVPATELSKVVALSLPTPPDLEAAWNYVAANREEIEQAIRENEAGDDGPVE